MAYKLTPVMQSQFRVTMPNLPNTYFTKVGGLQRQRDVTELGDGYSNDPVQVVGRVKASQITLSKPFDPTKDQALIDLFENWCEGDGSYTISITPVKICKNVEKAGLAIVCLDCKPIGLKYPDVDADANTSAAMIELTFATRIIKRS